MASRVVEIIIQTNDKTSAGVNAIISKFVALESRIQSAANRIKSFAAAKYQAAISLIDNVTPQGSRINSVLKSFVGKAYRLTVGITDSASSNLQSLNALAARLVARTYTISVNLKDNVSKKLSGISDGLLMGAGAMGGMLGTFGIGYGAANAVQSYMAFEKQMSKVQAVRRLDKDSDEMQALTQQAKDLGAQTAWTREQVGQAQYYQAMAGWSTQQILDATPAILNLASAGGTDLGTTADILTDTMTGFQLKAGETYRDAQGNVVEVSKHYADVMAAAVTNSNMDISRLGESLKYSASVIGSMYAGKDVQTRMHAVEDAMVLTGLQANAGIKGSQSGTTTRAIFSRFGSENRNAKFALDALGIDFVDKETGDVRRMRDIFGDLRKSFNQGADLDKIADFAEAISDQKINADTRRKLTSFMDSVRERGGEMTGADKLKLASMFAGQEGMSGFLAAMLGDWDALAKSIDNAHGAAQGMADTQLNNLAGDVTILGSAWDAFQQDLIEGKASEGLRSFVQTLTEVISSANNLFKDGIQIGDFGKILFDVVDRLRSKFLELDGIGSILAGGVLMGALTKIGSKIRSLMNSFRELRGVSATSTATSRGTVSASQSVSTMTVNAGVVNVNGKVGGASSRNVGNQAIIDRYNQTKERIRGTGTPPPATTPLFANAKSAGVTGGIMAATFGVMDVLGVKEHSKVRLQEAQGAVTYHEQELQRLRQSGATPEQIAAQEQEVRDAQAFVQRTEKLNRDEEFTAGAGATGMIIGSALGSALGPVGMMIGGMLGGMVGDALGQKAAESKIKSEEPARTDFFSKETPSVADFRKTQTPEVKPAQTIAEKQARQEATREQVERFDAINEKLGVASPFANSDAMNAAQDFYQQQQQFMTPNVEAPQYEFKNPFEGFEFENPFANLFDGFELPEFENPFANLFDGFELPEFENPFANLFEGFELPEFDFGGMFDSLSAQVSEFASTLPEMLSVAFDGLGEMISSGLDSAASSAESALSTIQSTFDSAREGIVSAWSELPGLFGGIFDGLGGVAASAGAAILSGLTSVCGAVISAWEGVSSTVSSIIAGIQAAASSVASMIPSIGGGVGKAEGGFVAAETHFFAGEHGPEVVIPLSSNQRSRALDLLDKTNRIFGGEPMTFGGDELQSVERDEFGNLTNFDVPEYNRVTENDSIAVRREKLAAQESLLADTPVAKNETPNLPNEIQMGGINISFNISGENPQDILETIREHLSEVTDQIAGKLSEQIGNVHANQPLEE